MKDIDFQVLGSFGIIKLMRPQALNALTHKMILSMEKKLIEWRNNQSVTGVMIEADGNRAFCAGGDITELYEAGLNGDFNFGKRFWADEYRLNSIIACYPKPYIVFMQGYTMGGGVGISCHGSHRIVGKSSKVAMPEVSIGLVPDVGGSFLLSNAPENIGTFLATTGYQMNAADAIYSGFADYFIPENEWPSLRDAIIYSSDLKIIDKYTTGQPHSRLNQLSPQIGWIVDENQKKTEFLKKIGSVPDLKPELDRFQKASPIAIAATFQILQNPLVGLSVNNALEIEFRYTSRAQQFSDFQEGVRAMVIDKDRKPIWKHKNLEAVTQFEVNKLLAPLSKIDTQLLKLKG